ncbi:MAG: alpha-L-fucosidase [Candidatus Omnitrophica bacterium]|nr:alpha-L-fucosidase [Candidatus Omnitrophota bacterium]
MNELRFRQVHLDFHTSELIKGVGEKFNPGEFVKVLKESNINSITCFAKCHHGMSYYNTKVGIKHPYLKKDLLKEMITACHANDILVPVYISVGWDEYIAKERPEWRQVGKDGKMIGSEPLQAGWKHICFNSPYADYIASQTEEVLKNYKSDGIFYDIIIHPEQGCFCKWCVKDRESLNLDNESLDDLKKHREIVYNRFMSRMYKLIQKIKPGERVFFNGTMRMDMRPLLTNLTHLEIESLPSGGWGYSHFPFYVRYCRTFGKDFLGMTARFHKSWADFGNLKNQAGLEYECFTMLANGAKCSIGDQLHPNGKLELPAYERIRDVYKSVSDKEQWCAGAKPVVEIGIISVGSQSDFSGYTVIHPSDEGAMRMLLETHHQFDILDFESAFSKYKLLILPDSITVPPLLQKKLDAFLKNGGRLILSYESGLDKEKTDFVLPQMGIKYKGKGEYTPDYFRVEKNISCRIPDMANVMYEGSNKVEAKSGTKILAAIVQPYFNRTYKHFSSHFQTPPCKNSGLPAVTINGNIVYIASPVFKAYKLHGCHSYRQLVENVLDLLMPDKILKAELPSTCQATVTEQKNRWITHLIHYIPERRANLLDIVEDTIPLYNLNVSIRTGWTPSKAYLAPERKSVEFKQNGEYFSCNIPRVYGHAMLVLEK